MTPPRDSHPHPGMLRPLPKLDLRTNKSRSSPRHTSSFFGLQTPPLRSESHCASLCPVTLFGTTRCLSPQSPRCFLPSRQDATLWSQYPPRPDDRRSPRFHTRECAPPLRLFTGPFLPTSYGGNNDLFWSCRSAPPNPTPWLTLVFTLFPKHCFFFLFPFLFSLFPAFFPLSVFWFLIFFFFFSKPKFL